MGDGLLDRILACKRAEIAALGPSSPPRGDGSGGAARDVLGALRRSAQMALIAEVKFKSPSAGELSRALGPGERAVAYARGGAAMVSVLCDGPFFGGSFADLRAARDALDAHGFASLPVLAKEFILDEAQLDRARDAGADAALLIVRILASEPRGTLDALGALVRACRSRSLEPFVEVASEEELACALDAGARLVGVNARDLDTLVMDAARAERVLDLVPRDRVVAVHLSGLRDAEQVAGVARSRRTDAALVGEALMRADHPEDILKRFVEATQRP